MKKEAKKIISKLFSDINYPIVINSYGRSGSTVLTKSIIESLSKEKQVNIQNLLSRSISEEAWSLDSTGLKNGMVYKTHDYPPKRELNNDIRMIYTFANPVDVVLSLKRLYTTRGEEWMREHYQHLKVPFGNFDNIINEDQLNLEKHLNTWLYESRFPIAFVKYESMWDYQAEISQFLNLPVELPAFKERKAKTKSNAELRLKLAKTYSSLIKKINNLDCFFINNNN